MATRDDALKELNETRSRPSVVPISAASIAYQDAAGNHYRLNWDAKNGISDQLVSKNPNPLTSDTPSAISKKNDFDLMTFLKKEHYGVPVYGWGLGAIGVAGLGGLAYYFLRRS